MREPLGNGIDKAREAIQLFPSRPGSWDAHSVVVTASAEPSRSSANGSLHSVYGRVIQGSTRPKEQVCSILDAHQYRKVRRRGRFSDQRARKFLDVLSS